MQKIERAHKKNEKKKAARGQQEHGEPTGLGGAHQAIDRHMANGRPVN